MRLICADTVAQSVLMPLVIHGAPSSQQSRPGNRFKIRVTHILRATSSASSIAIGGRRSHGHRDTVTVHGYVKTITTTLTYTLTNKMALETQGTYLLISTWSTQISSSCWSRGTGWAARVAEKAVGQGSQDVAVGCVRICWGHERQQGTQKLNLSSEGERRSSGRCGRKSYGTATFLLTQADWHNWNNDGGSFMN